MLVKVKLKSRDDSFTTIIEADSVKEAKEEADNMREGYSVVEAWVVQS